MTFDLTRTGPPPETWIFDLDDTLYAPSAGLLAQINWRMTDYIVRELGVSEATANDMRAQYWAQHGITLVGLVEDHGVDPGHFLEDTHSIDLAPLAPDPALVRALGALPGRRIVHTNGSRAHAARVLAAVGLDGAFDQVIAIEDTALIPKPRAEAYQTVLARTGLDPARALMVEDLARNLEQPRRLGMRTAWLDHGTGAEAPDYVDHRITDLAVFLSGQGR